MGLLTHMIVLFVILWETSILFSIMAAPTYIPTNSVEMFPFSIPFPVFICGLFNDGHSYQCEVIPYCSFDLHFSNNYQCCSSFHMPVGHLSVCLLWRNVCLVLPVFLLDYFFLLLSCISYLYMLEIKPLLVTSFANIFCHFIGCLHFVYGFLCCAKASNFD